MTPPFLFASFALYLPFVVYNPSSKLLLDKEGPQVGELPCAGCAEDDELDDDPAHDAGVCRLGLVSELGLSLL